MRFDFHNMTDLGFLPRWLPMLCRGVLSHANKQFLCWVWSWLVGAWSIVTTWRVCFLWWLVKDDMAGLHWPLRPGHPSGPDGKFLVFGRHHHMWNRFLIRFYYRHHQRSGRGAGNRGCRCILLHTRKSDRGARWGLLPTLVGVGGDRRGVCCWCRLVKSDVVRFRSWGPGVGRDRLIISANVLRADFCVVPSLE